MAGESFTIDMNEGDNRRRIALMVLERRLAWAIRVGQTDPVALQAARKWADKDFRTSKQALKWINDQNNLYEQLDTAHEQAAAYLGQLSVMGDEEQTNALFELTTWAFLNGWLPAPAADPDATPHG